MAQQTKSKKQDKKAPKMIGVNIPVAEVRVGDLLVTKEQKGKVFGTSALKAEDFGICNDKWRTHLHIRGGCYDERFSTVRIAFEDDRDEVQELADELLYFIEIAHKLINDSQLSPEERLLLAIFGDEKVQTFVDKFGG